MFIRFIQDFGGVIKLGQRTKHVKYRRGQKIFVDNVISTLDHKGVNNGNYLVVVGKQDMLLPKSAFEIV